MDIIEIQSELRDSGFYFKVVGEKLTLEADDRVSEEALMRMKENFRIITFIRQNKKRIIEHLKKQPATGESQPNGNAITALYQLSPLQEGMLFHSLLNKKDSAYCIQFTCSLVGLDVDIFRASWNYIIKKHTALRTRFHHKEFKVPLQSVSGNLDIPIEQINLRKLPSDEQLAFIDIFKKKDREAGFDIGSAPLMRFVLFQLDEFNTYMLWSYHHLILDGWSIPILMSEFLRCYEELRNGKVLEHAAEDRFEDYIRYLKAIDQNAVRAYWVKYLKGLESGTPLPFVKNGVNKGISTDYPSSVLIIADDTFTQVQHYASKHGLTINTLVQGAWAFLLHKYVDRDHVCFGVVVSGRPDDLENIESRVGMFVNTLLFHSEMDPSVKITDWLRGIFDTQLESRQYQFSSLSEIKDWSGIAGDLFHSLFMFENYPIQEAITSNTGYLKADNATTYDRTHYPLTLTSQILRGQLKISFKFDPQLIEPEFIEQIKQDFERVLSQLISTDNDRLLDIQLVTASINAPANDATPEGIASTSTTIVNLFEEQVRINRGSVAVVDGVDLLTYEGLNDQSNNLGNHLRAKYGLKPDDVVGVMMTKSVRMIVGLLGILKSGAAYLPLDPQSPEDRLKTITQEAGVTLLLIDSASLPDISQFYKGDIFAVDIQLDLLERINSNLAPVNTAKDLAYIMYTSGSTGRPNGVMIEHQSIAGLVKSENGIKLNESSVLLSTGSVSFDAVTFEYWGMLLNGGKLVLRAQEYLIEPTQLLDIIRKNGVNIMWFTSSWFNQMVDTDIHLFATLATLIVGGEAISSMHVNKLKRQCPHIQIVNGYGPTENTTFTTFHEIKEYYDGPVPIGTPLKGVEIFVFDRNLQLQPRGIPGELYLGGRGLARGYVNNDRLNQQRFIEHPFRPGQRLYKTGDTGLLTHHDCFEYRGRNDDQVKINGYRVELQEIEQAIKRITGLNDAAVVLLENGTKKIVAYYTGKNLPYDEIVDQLGHWLPSYMIPGHFFNLETMPLTANGKLDRKSLPAVDTSLAETKEELPEDDNEVKILDVWKNVLGIDNLGVTDNFFVVGGDSIKAIRLVSAMNKECLMQVQVKDVFAFPTVRLLAGQQSFGQPYSDVSYLAIDPVAIGDMNEAEQQILNGYDVREIYPMTDVEKGMIFHSLLDSGAAVYHDQFYYAFEDKSFDLARFNRAFVLLVEKHEILRANFLPEREHPIKIVCSLSSVNLNIKLEDISQLAPPDQQDFLKRFFEADRSQRFIVTAPGLWRLQLFRSSHNEYGIAWTFHHAILDGWSNGLLLAELSTLYIQLEKDPHQRPTPLRVDYENYIRSQHTIQLSKITRDFWLDELKGYQRTSLPFKKPLTKLKSNTSSSLNISIDKELFERIKALSKSSNVSIKQICLGAFLFLVRAVTSERDITIGLVSNTRPEVDDGDKILGCFLNTIPFRLHVDNDLEVSALLKAVSTQESRTKGHDKLSLFAISRLAKGRDSSVNQIFDILFNFVDFRMNTLGPIVKLKNGPIDDHENSNTYFDFAVSHETNRLVLKINHKVDLYHPDEIQRIGGYYQRILDRFTHAPTISVSDVISQEERDLVRGFNDTRCEFTEKSVIESFEDRVKAVPSAIALHYRDSDFTYGFIHERAVMVARHLRRLKGNLTSPIPVCISDELLRVIAILGIMKSGHAFVPIDPKYPADRIRFILEDTNANLIMVHGEENTPIDTLDWSGIKVDINREGTWLEQEAFLPEIQPHDLAYVIYTSGSTGKPKGVMIEHASLANCISGFCQELKIDGTCKLLSLTNFTFDIFYLELFLPLVTGGTVVLGREEILEDLGNLNTKLQQYRPTLIQATPSIWQILFDAHLQPFEPTTLLVGGEFVPDELKAKMAYVGDVLAVYGPTETTIWSLTCNRPGAPGNVIGKPMSNISVFIIDDAGELVPMGVPGEIGISGNGVARGYLNAPELTESKFIPGDLLGWPGKIYRTGDQGRWLLDGTIEFLGRNDNQVKIHGYRIELGEIESALLQSALVTQAVVVVGSGPNNSKTLIAYVIPANDYTKSGLILHVKSVLPEYMVPSTIVEKDELPLTSNGKIDRRMLSELIVEHVASVHIEPVTEYEKVLATVWCQILKLDQISVEDDFFTLGGHSLLAMRLASAIRAAVDVRITLKDVFLFPTIRMLAVHLEGSQKIKKIPFILRTEKLKHLPLSFGQQRLWFLDKLYGSVAYHLPVILTLRGNLNVQWLTDAFQSTINRHEVLRTVIEEEEDRVWQRVLPESTWQLGFLNVDESISSHENTLQHTIAALIETPFNLSVDHKLRATLLKIQPDHHVLVITLHHIASDGWSIPIMVNELSTFYNAGVTGRENILDSLTIQYSDYALWQQERLNNTDWQKKLEYWTSQLIEVSPLNLPTDYQRPVVQSHAGKVKKLSIGNSLASSIRLLGKSRGATLYMTMLAAFNVLLYRLSGQNDICVGSAIANRELREIEELIGFFNNTLAMRTTVNGRMSFESLLSQVKIITMNAYENQEIPLEKIVDLVVKTRDTSRTPLFQVMFDVINKSESTVPVLEGLDLHFNQIEQTTSKFDLTFTIQERSENLDVKIEYSSDLFKDDTIERIGQYYMRLLESITVSPGKEISTLEMMSMEELLELEASSKGKQVEIQNEHTVLDLFNDQVRKSPDQVALRGEYVLTYCQLDAWVIQLADHLRKNGIDNEKLVIVCMEPGVLQVVSILAIMKAGGAYVPVDPFQPEDRVREIIQDSSAEIVLTSRLCMNMVQGHGSTILIEDLCKTWSSSVSHILPSEIHGGSLAYVIYTSGSTGRPKGVMIEHKSLLNYLVNRKTQYIGSANQTSGSYAHMANSFDASLTALFMPLITGKTLVITNGSPTNPLGSNIVDQGPYDFIKVTPSHLELLKTASSSGRPVTRRLVIGGEALRYNHLSHWIENGEDFEIVNEYGPTEATVGCSVHWFKTTDELIPKNISIGLPLDNVTMFVVGPDEELLPVGVPGELVVGGICVARGYLNRVELTHEKFRTSTISGVGRVYRTGDIAKWNANGLLEYCGRADDQVKLHGYRVELGEIENVLMQSAMIEEVAVAVKEGAGGTNHLIAYVRRSGRLEETLLRDYVAKKLPEYMVPRTFIRVDHFALTRHGKIDRQMLPQPEDSRQVGDAQPGRNEMEIALIKIWEELLGVNGIGVNDNFFDLGGDSIVSIQMINRCIRAGYRLDIGDVFEHQTIAGLCSEYAKGVIDHSDESTNGKEAFGLLPIQQWYFDLPNTNRSHFNQSVLLRIEKNVTEEHLSTLAKELVQHHESLRIRFTHLNGSWMQRVTDDPGALQVIDLTALHEIEVAAKIEEECNRYQRSLSIEEGPLFYFLLFVTPRSVQKNRLVVIIHHLVIDGVSWRILFDDIGTLLQGNPLAKRTTFTAPWRQALLDYGSSTGVLSQRKFWEDTQQRFQPLKGSDEKPSTVSELQSVVTILDQGKTGELLKRVNQAYHTEVTEVLLSCLAATMAEWQDWNHVVIGLEGHGREIINDTVNLQRTVGWFTTHYPVQLEVNGLSNGDLIKNVKEQLRLIPDKGLGYGVLRFMNNVETLTKQPWDVVFNYLGQTDRLVEEGLPFTIGEESTGKDVDDDFVVLDKLTIVAHVRDGKLKMRWSWCSRCFSSHEMKALSDGYMQRLGHLIDHCVAQQRTNPTPSDFGLANHHINWRRLDEYLNSNIQGAKRVDLIERLYPLTALQQGILFHSLLEGGSNTYVSQLRCVIKKIDIDAFHTAWAYLIAKHSILRTGFDHESFPIPIQFVCKKGVMPIEVVALPSGNEETSLEEFVATDRVRPFDLENPPLMRITLVKKANGTYHLVWTFHHILTDGWSMAILMREYLEVYEQVIQKDLLITNDIHEDKYEDFLKYLNKTDKAQQESYWKNYLVGLKESSLLPFVSSAVDRNKGIGGYEVIDLCFNADDTNGIELFAKENRFTVNTVMQAVLAYVLHRYTNSNQVVYGTTVSGRSEGLNDAEHRVGLYINTLPIYSTIADDQLVLDWLRSLQNSQVQSRKYQHTMLSDIQKWTGITGDMFDTLLVFENYPVSEVISSRQWALEIKNVDIQEHTNYPLTILVSTGRELRIAFSYNGRLVDELYVTQIRRNFGNVLKQLVSGSSRYIGELKLLTEPEEHQILNEFNSTEVVYQEKTVIILFEEQVERTPNDVALIFGDSTLTYRELNKRANRLAHYLVKQGVQESTLVPICLERSFEMVIGILGILKAGGAYVPVDPMYPADRIGYMLTDTNVSVVITSHLCQPLVNGHTGMTLVKLTDEAIQLEDDSNVGLSSRPDKLTYLIYTSGTTGRPKGIRMPDMALVNLLLWHESMSETSNKCVLQFASINFDVSFRELFSALCFGGSVCLIGDQERKDMGSVLETISTHGVNHLFIPFVVLKNLCLYANEFFTFPKSLQKIFTAGEQLKLSDDIRSFVENTGVEILNHYGPSETHVVTWYPVAISDFVNRLHSPIGKPISNTTIYVLDARQRPCAIGVVGELYIGGVQVAHGYLNNPELTNEKFIPDHLGKSSGSLYRTGDLARWLPDGNVEFLGRTDDQVKIRGNRVEPAEVENVLTQLDQIKHAVIIVRPDAQGNKRLIAYVVANGTLDNDLTFAHLRSKIPDYMIPDLILQVASMPITANGKVDKRSLPVPDSFGGTPSETKKPGNEIESKLVDIWKELLDLNRVSVLDNFFEIGGNSLLTTRLTALIGRAFSVRIPVSLLFTLTTIEDISKYIELQSLRASVEKNEASTSMTIDI